MADYATLAALKDRVQISASTYDATLESLITAASRKIDRLCRRPDGFVALTTATARYYAGSGGPIQWIDECTNITTVSVKEAITDTTYTDWTTSDWAAGRGDSANPDLNHTPYEFLTVTPWGDYSYFPSGRFSGATVTTVKVTAKWGYATAVPYDIAEATLMQAVRWWKRLQSGMSDTLASGELGMMLYQMQLDPDIAGILRDGRYVRHTVG